MFSYLTEGDGSLSISLMSVPKQCDGDSYRLYEDSMHPTTEGEGCRFDFTIYNPIWRNKVMDVAGSAPNFAFISLKL